jgi:hypothetical protein
MKTTIFFISVLAMSIILPSCKSRKPVSDAGSIIMDTPATPEMEIMLRKVMDTQVNYTWFSATGQGKVDWDGQRLSAKVNVRILRDSVIWVQIQKLGFEVGRMMVTPDSAFFINRFERTYAVGRTEDLLEEYNVPADFEMFSLVFTAGAYVPSRIRKSIMEADGSVLLQAVNGMEARHWLDPSSMLIRSLVTDPLSREWYAVYSDYKKTNSGERFPFKRSNTLVIDGQPNVFDLEYSEMTIDVPQEFPFSIPSHYEKI